MKRLIVCGVVVAALTLPALAAGNSFVYLGPLQGGNNNAGIEFKIKFKNHHPRKVLRVEYHNVYGTTASSSLCYPPEGQGQPGWTINRKAKFHGTLHTGSYAATISGKLRKPANRFRRIFGTIRIQGNGCDTGALSYVAKRGG
jgi:hypothetical protein